jgi:hypothetical protein
MEIFYHEIRRKPEVDAFLHEWNNAEDFIVCHTSGSTGTPKTIRLDKSKMRKSAQKTIAFFNLKSGIKVEDYEAWASAKDLPTVKALPSIAKFEVLRATDFGVPQKRERVLQHPPEADRGELGQSVGG